VHTIVPLASFLTSGCHFVGSWSVQTGTPSIEGVCGVTVAEIAESGTSFWPSAIVAAWKP
jgi:hypothetical protein